MFKRKPVLLTYYITNRCNAKCKFCNIWKEGPKKDAKKDTVLRNLKIARNNLNIKFVDFTGGEPLLHENIITFLKSAKKLNYKTSITTNTKLYPEYAEKLKGLVDFLLFSIDGTKDYHNENRGGIFYRHLLESINIAKKLNEKPDLIFTATNKSIQFLDEMINIAQNNNLILQINPIFPYSKIDKSLSGNNINKIKKAFKKKNVYVNLAQLKLILKGGNRRNNPRCRGVTSNLVISQDNKIILPCYHNMKWKIDIKNNLAQAFYSKKRKNIEKKQGTFKFCEGCTINCYFDPSFEYKLDSYMFWSLLSRGKYAIEKYFFNKIRG